MKKGKTVSMPTSVEGQIKSRARNLPIDKCYINPDWEGSQMADVIVTRKHSNGNLTVGFFLVDLLLLGVKDCFYKFNQPEHELEELIDDGDFIECSYELAHNVVYSGIGFAEDYGFEPCKDFKTGMYILEEDTDGIPLVEVPVGKDGKPVVFINAANNRRQEIAQLEKTAGKGNFDVIYMGDTDDFAGNFDEENEENVENDDDWDNDDDDDDDDDFDIDEYQELMVAFDSDGFEKACEKFRNDMTLGRIHAMAEYMYRAVKYDENEIKQILRETDQIIDDPRFDRDEDLLKGIEGFSSELTELINSIDIEQENSEAWAKIRLFLSQYPDNIELAAFLYIAIADVAGPAEIKAFVEDWNHRMGDHYLARLMYLGWLILDEQYDKALEMIGDARGLDILTPGEAYFTGLVVNNFCSFCILAFLSKQDIRSAEPYYSVLTMTGNHSRLSLEAMAQMTHERHKILTEIANQ